MKSAGDRSLGESFDVAAAEQVLIAKCSQCHSRELALVNSVSSRDEVSQLVSALIGDGLVATNDEPDQIVEFLEQHHKLSGVDSDSSQVTLTKPATTCPVQMPGLAREKGGVGCHQIPSATLGQAWLDVEKKI